MSIFNQGKLSKPEFISKMICTLLSFLIFGLVTALPFPGDRPGDLGTMHMVFNWVFWVMAFGYVTILFRKSLNENLEWDFRDDEGSGRYYAGVPTLVVALVVMILGTNSWNNSRFIYNTSYTYQNENTRIEQQKKTYYDNMWKSYQLKDNVVLQNKEMFLEVTNIIMGARKDGANLTWKWLTENQPIPYSEFTDFYRDLSSFIESQRAGLLAIENQSQVVAQANNTLLDTFPNNVYNKVLNRPHIEYKPGFTSTRTEKVFTSGIEDLEPRK